VTRRPLLAIVLVVGLLLVEGSAFADVRFDPDALFADSAIREVVVSPTGDWVVAHVIYGETSGVIAQRRGDGITIPLYSTDIAITGIGWIGDDSLLVRHSATHTRQAALIRLEWNGSTIVHDELPLTRKGFLVDRLADQDEIVLWATFSRGRSMVVRGPASALASGRWRFSGEAAGGELETIVELDENVWTWIVDRDGVVRVAQVLKGTQDPAWSLMYRSGEGDGWQEVWRARDQEEEMIPLAMAADGQRMIVATRANADTMGIYEFDPESREVGDVVFSAPDVDVVGALYDENRELIAAIYMRAGERRYYYLDGYREKYLEEVEGLAAGESVSVTSASRDHRFVSFVVHGARNPGTYYFLDTETGTQTTLGSVLPGVSRDPLVDIEAVPVVSADGTVIEAFLALPRGQDGGKPPLLVLPHGGPIGVRDDTSFDPLLQFIAIDGVAVLKVNYRGSSGYGKSFEEAGKGEWAGAILEDIDAAIQAIVERGLVSPDRICIAGGSFGGYAAMMSVIRWPERYRCASTLNGPSDLPLQFQSSDTVEYKGGYEALVEIIGDPDADFDHLVEISPAYNVDKLAVPVLVVHGDRDRRVDPDHAHRLRAMLVAHGKPYEWLVLSDTGHSPAPNERRIYARKLRSFLRKHLREQPNEAPANR
jgi:dipeptidyl aminopeptidase/acylaminoacyl peptidase